MKYFRKIGIGLLVIVLIPIHFLLISLVLTFIPVNNFNDESKVAEVYLSTNGIHLDIVIPNQYVPKTLLSQMTVNQNEKYLSFGWGDENFYINTPTWNDLTYSNAFNALFLNSTSLMHVTRYENKQSHWVEVQVGSQQLEKLNNFIFKSFALDDNQSAILLPNQGYHESDNFYKSNASYSCINTCNSWVNSAFKESGLPACLWTPFDFGLISKYQ